MENTLLFYEKEDYYDFKDSKALEGYSIISIAKLFHNQSMISEVDVDSKRRLPGAGKYLSHI